ncbi:MAG TPA: hypothetical protein PLW99_02170, partial [Candidatus Paceibacterota bacterium]|nr:hypothetical protein [Candidatus Paceibacterota bacterium]
VVNEPTEEHAAALFTIAFKALPSQLVVWNEKNFQTYLAKQVTGSYAGLGTPNYRVCLAFLYPEFGDACAVIHKKVSGFWGSDFSIATTLLHEYAHYLDKNLYAPEQGTSLGIIDTSGFYAISYDTSKGTVTSNGWTEYPFLRPNDVANEFVSSYAEGWGNDSIHTAYEDFAESFALYVTGGRIFRELAKTSPVLSEKYLWLKEHVFGGQEYDTGDVASIAYLKAHATASGADAVATKAFNVIDYATQLPDFDWSYTF